MSTFALFVDLEVHPGRADGFAGYIETAALIKGRSSTQLHLLLHLLDEVRG